MSHKPLVVVLVLATCLVVVATVVEAMVAMPAKPPATTFTPTALS